MQCKNIPDKPILELLSKRNSRGSIWYSWFPGVDDSVANAMPDKTPRKLILAKMDMLVRRGLVSGCCCGCRGDFEITEKGKAFLAL